jgi:hypothetical protein
LCGGGGILIPFRHTALDFVPEEHKAEMNKGWASMHDRVAGKPRPDCLHCDPPAASNKGGKSHVPSVHNNRSADCRQRHLDGPTCGNRNQEIRREERRRQYPIPALSKLSRTKNGAGEIVPNSNQRRDQECQRA